MRFLLIFLAGYLMAQSPSPKITAGTLACYAIRRAPVASLPGWLNVQTYCYRGSAVISNHSNLIPPGGSIIDNNGDGRDGVAWQFWDNGGGTIRFQVSNGGPVVQGVLP